MGLPEVAGKWPEKWKTSCDSRWPPPPLRRPDPGASGGGWPWNFTAGFVWMSSSHLSGACIVIVAGGASFGPISHGSQMVKLPNSGPQVLESFSRVLEFKMVFWGLGFHLASKVMFI